MATKNISNKEVTTIITEGFASANEQRSKAQELLKRSQAAFDRLEDNLVHDEDISTVRSKAWYNKNKSIEMDWKARGYMGALYQLADIIGVSVHKLEDGVNVELTKVEEMQEA